MESGVNPRECFEGHRERGPKKFAFTYQDYAELLGVTPGWVKHLVSGENPAFDPADLASVLDFAMRRRLKKDVVFLLKDEKCASLAFSANPEAVIADLSVYPIGRLKVVEVCAH